MSKYKLLLLTVCTLLSINLFATSVNGRFVVVKSDTSSMSVKLQINTDTGRDDMGGATIVISFDKNVIDYSSDPIKNKDYIFSNFSGGYYNEATVTRPMNDKLWINIDLPNENANKGYIVSGSSGWTDVVTLNFNIKNHSDTAKVNWLKNNIFWQIYDGDNQTSWSTGKLDDIVIAPAKISLLSFTATLLDNNKDIKLDWSTISYENNSGFEIEKSLKSDGNTSPDLTRDDISSATNWQKVGFVQSKNILNTSVNYSFVDNGNNTNSNYKYRLKSVNTDATYTILAEVEVALQPQSFELQQNYPNPFNPSTKIKYNLPSNVNGQLSNVSLKVYDILGNEVATLVNEVQSAGQHEVEFKADNLASGVYLYRLETPNFTATKKMVLLR